MHAEYTLPRHVPRVRIRDEKNEGTLTPSIRTFDPVTTCDRLHRGRFAYDLYERFPLVSLLVEVSDIPGGKGLC